jgi:MinD superfamily P-loop ATPase
MKHTPMQEPMDYITEEEMMDIADKTECRHCEKCQRYTVCELIPMMGYSLYLCERCAIGAYRSGETV